jgi:hypothetical protein
MTFDSDEGASQAFLERGSGDGFRLAGAETDAAVRSLTSEAEGARVAGSNDRSIQGIDSLSLFERVRGAHKNCMKEGCVSLR